MQHPLQWAATDCEQHPHRSYSCPVNDSQIPTPISVRPKHGLITLVSLEGSRSQTKAAIVSMKKFISARRSAHHTSMR